jgi:hypothetical protein
MAIKWGNYPTIFGWNQLLKVVCGNREISIKIDDMIADCTVVYNDVTMKKSEPSGEANFECEFKDNLWNLLATAQEESKKVYLTTDIHGTLNVTVKDIVKNNDKMFVSTKINWET